MREAEESAKRRKLDNDGSSSSSTSSSVVVGNRRRSSRLERKHFNFYAEEKITAFEIWRESIMYLQVCFAESLW